MIFRTRTATAPGEVVGSAGSVTSRSGQVTGQTFRPSSVRCSRESSSVELHSFISRDRSSVNGARYGNFWQNASADDESTSYIVSVVGLRAPSRSEPLIRFLIYSPVLIFFIDRLSNKPFLIWLLPTPPHLKYVATLPCNLSLIVCFLTLIFHKVVWQHMQGLVGF